MDAVSEVLGKDRCLITAATAWERWRRPQASTYGRGRDMDICPKGAIEEMTMQAEA